jgi:hypothetical protein
MGEARNRGTFEERRTQAEVDCHAQISLTAGAKGLELESVCLNEPDNPAVKFAKWLCENSVELFQQMVASEAKSRIITDVTPRLHSADGGLINGDAGALVGPDGETLQ